MISRLQRLAASLAFALMASAAIAAPPAAKFEKLNAAEAAIAGVSYEGDDAIDTITAADSAPQSITLPYGRAWSGAANGDVTLVIFADYGCPPCREAQTVTDRLIAEDPKLRVVYRFIALEGYSGRAPAYASFDVAAEEIYDKAASFDAEPNKSDWNAFHRALIARKAVTKKAIGEVARAVKLPTNILTLDYSLTDPAAGHHNSMSYDSELAGNEAELNYRGVSSLPAWAIGDGKVTEGHDYIAIKTAIAEARAAAK